MKIAGMLSVIISSLIFSAGIVRFYSERLASLTVLRYILTDIQSVINFAPRDIYSICREYLSCGFAPFDGIFGRCIYGQGEFIDEMKSALADTPLIDGEAAKIMICAFEGIMNSSREGAVSHLQVCADRLSVLCSEEREECERKKNMYSKLSVAGAAMVCVLLV